MGERKRVSIACTACRKSHLKCDSGRPCSRCIKKGISHLCRTADSKRRGRKGDSNRGSSSVVTKNRSLMVPLKKRLYMSGMNAGAALNGLGKDNNVVLDRSSVRSTLTIEEASEVLLAFSFGTFDF
eukprot:TRINITY_DN110_c0_g1_i1.p1 TRINITY_DN110_c0_g1~~TRINITY_DN110_c0_g1_i1.p1  ORF type:complete len:126 (-),score=11.87 TRINITY_DN110_c0_g1_i1:139-516(-)